MWRPSQSRLFFVLSVNSFPRDPNIPDEEKSKPVIVGNAWVLSVKRRDPRPTRLLNSPVAGASPNITQSDIHHMISMRTIVMRGFEGFEEPGIAIADVHESLIGDKKL